MKPNRMLISAGIVASLVVSGVAIHAAQDNKDQNKYTLKVPNGLAVSEFKGYESWQLVSSLWNMPERKRWFGGGYDAAGISRSAR